MKMKNKFTKADLKAGDVVKFRNEITGIVNLELNILTSDGWVELNYKDDLTHTFYKNWDIVAVRRPRFKWDCRFNAFERSCGILVYERQEPEEMTLAEVCKLLGREIKIVKG